ncbi:MAG: ImmA/IrrE family metallo-endopeptidase [Pseudomonadales bacterium]|nr:ImmA/IrrE family metallo-endopeptidase [Pseudomonadales bacterium]
MADTRETRNEYHPDYLVTPSAVLEYELTQRCMTQNELARRTGLTTKHIIDLVKSKSRITPETAIKLERAIGMPVDYWLTLEAHYQEALARQHEGTNLDKDLFWLDRLPIKDMAKLGWIARFKDKRQQLEELLRFFGIANVGQWDNLWPTLEVAYRQHNKQEVLAEAVSAWLRQGEISATGIGCKDFDKEVFRHALDEIKTMTDQLPEAFQPRMQALCATAGVAVVFVPALPKTGISGATRWVSPTKAVIQLSLRYKSNDQLWFTFFHEAGHIMLHGKKELFLEGLNGMQAEKEAEADAFAQKELVSRKALLEFMAEGDYSPQAIKRFAKSINIAPGIVVGQLQHEKALGWNQCNELKCYYKWQHED